MASTISSFHHGNNISKIFIYIFWYKGKKNKQRAHFMLITCAVPVSYLSKNGATWSIQMVYYIIVSRGQNNLKKLKIIAMIINI